MNILYIAPRIPVKPFDGGAYMVFHQLRCLVRAGHTVILCAPNTSRHPAKQGDELGICSQLVSTDVDTSISIWGAVRALLGSKEPAPTGLPRAPYTLQRFFSKELFENVLAVIKSQPVDVILADYLQSSWYALALRHTLADACPPVVYRANNVEHQILVRLANGDRSPLHERMYRRLLVWQTEQFERTVAAAVDSVVSISELDAQWFEQVAPNTALTVVPPGIDVPTPVERHLQAIPRIGMLGSLEWTPNVEGLRWFLRDIAPLIWKENPNVEIHLAGRSPLPEVLAWHDGKRVFVHGAVDSAADFLSTLHVGIIPLLSGSGVRIKLLEGLAHGLPMVTTHLGAEGIDVQDTEHVLMADSAQTFANACLALLADQKQAQEMAFRGRDLVRERYSWEDAMDKLVRVFASVIEKRASYASTA